MKKKIIKELLGGWTTFEKSYICLLVILQIIVFYFNPESPVGMVAGISGVLCVTFVAKGKISNYFFGFIQISLYLILSLEFALYGEVLLNVFYFIMQIIGVNVWRKHMQEKIEIHDAVIEARSLTVKQWLVTLLITMIAWYLFGTLLDYIGSNNPYLDSITTALSVVAQLLMVWRYKEQWILWIIVNIFSIVLWAIVGNASMVAMWCAFLFNSSYGYYNWLHLAKRSKV